MEWLKGKSLRTLGRMVGKSRTTLMMWFRKRYGKHATSPKHTALAKSIIQDYPDTTNTTDVIWRALEHSGTYYSQHSLNMLTEYQCLREPRLVYWVSDIELDEPEEGLLLPYFILFVNCLCKVLEYGIPTTTNTSTEGTAAIR